MWKKGQAGLTDLLCCLFVIRRGWISSQNKHYQVLCFPFYFHFHLYLGRTTEGLGRLVKSNDVCIFFLEFGTFAREETCPATEKKQSRTLGNFNAFYFHLHLTPDDATATNHKPRPHFPSAALRWFSSL